MNCPPLFSRRSLDGAEFQEGNIPAPEYLSRDLTSLLPENSGAEEAPRSKRSES